MRRIVGCALLVGSMVLAAAPAVSADSAAWRVRHLDCGEAGMHDFALPPSEFVTAFVPLHEVGGTSILTIKSITVDGDTYVSKPPATKDGDRLVTCAYVDPAGLSISIVGMLTPGK